MNNISVRLLLKETAAGVPWWHSDLGAGIVTSVDWATAVAQVQCLAQELPHAAGLAKNFFKKSG